MALAPQQPARFSQCAMIQSRDRATCRAESLDGPQSPTAAGGGNAPASPGRQCGDRRTLVTAHAREHRAVALGNNHISVATRI